MQTATTQPILPSGALQPGMCSEELAHFATRLSSQFYLSDYNRAKHERMQQQQQQQQQPAYVPPTAHAHPPPLPPTPLKFSAYAAHHAQQQQQQQHASVVAPLKPLTSALPSPPSSASISGPDLSQENDSRALDRQHQQQSPRRAFSGSPRTGHSAASEGGSSITPDDSAAPASGRTSPIRAPFNAPLQKPLRSPSPTRPSPSSSLVPPMLSAVKHALDLEPEPDRDNTEDPTKRPPIFRSASAPSSAAHPPQQQTTPQAVPSHLIKTSKTHPLHISPLLPYDALTHYHRTLFGPTPTPDWVGAADETTQDQLQDAIWFLKHGPLLTPESDLLDPSAARPPSIGNFLLSSCPGKKVRLTLPFPPNQGNRSAISRDVYLDLERIATNPDYSAKAVLCCLDDDELALLGAPWPEYKAAAAKLGLTVFRLPLAEGFAPASIDVLDALLQDVITQFTLRGHNVLCHCRGGVGRAGLVGVAWWLKMGLAGHLQSMSPATAVERCVRWIRQRRSTKAIETPVQVLYLHQFISHLAQHGQARTAASLLPPRPTPAES